MTAPSRDVDGGTRQEGNTRMPGPAPLPHPNRPARPAAPRYPFGDPGEITRAMNEAIRRLQLGAGFPQHYLVGRYPSKGDKVEVTITGYVGDIDRDGVITLVDERTAFPDDATVIATLPRRGKAAVTIVEQAPVEPRVGDTITGATLKATPWKRGTMVRTDIAFADDARYVLTAAGRWRSIRTGDEYEFSEFHNAGRYVVEHAPGKAAK